MHHCAREYTFASTMSQIDESSSRYVVSIVSTLRVLVFLSPLDPPEYLEERFEFDLAVG